MIKQYETRLDCNNILRSNWNMLIETFIDYYGENKRQEIEEKFSRALPIAYISPNTKSSILSAVAKENTNILVETMLKSIPSNWTKEELLNNNNLDDIKYSSLYNFSVFYNLHKMSTEEREKKYNEDSLNVQTEYEKSFKLASKLLTKIDSNITLENFDDYLQNNELKSLIKYAELLPILTNKYELLMKKYEPYKLEIDEQKRIDEDLKNKYFIEFIEDNKDLLSKNDLELVETYKNDYSKKNYLSSYIKAVFGYNLDQISVLDSFSQETENILNNPEQTNWKKNSIIRDRINYFKQKGIDLGNDYNAYLNSEEAKLIWPSFERVTKFQESRNHILSEYNKAFCTNLPSYKKIKDEIDSLSLLDKENSSFDELYTNSRASTFVSPNIQKKDNYYSSFSLIFVNCDKMYGIVDHNIIHELNHLFEIKLCDVKDNSYEMVSGWDIINGNINQTEVKQENNEETRSYELFNEIINEMITQEIYVKMLEKDNHIFDTKENAKVSNFTAYEQSSFLVKEFFNEYKEEIIESRSNGNIGIIFNKVGKENFDALNQLFEIYYEKFSGFNYINLWNELKANKETENTKDFYELIQMKNKILEGMRNYSKMTEQVEKSGGLGM